VGGGRGSPPVSLGGLRVASGWPSGASGGARPYRSEASGALGASGGARPCPSGASGGSPPVSLGLRVAVSSPCRFPRGWSRGVNDDDRGLRRLRLCRIPLPGYLKAVWPDFLGVFLKSRRICGGAFLRSGRVFGVRF
jgi:hypothetical protein